MLCLNRLHGFSVFATDGNIGTVNEFYFDDKAWAIRYLVLGIDPALSDRRVLVPCAALGNIDHLARALSVALTSEQVLSGPDIESRKPVYRQRQRRILDHLRQFAVRSRAGVAKLPAEATYKASSQNEPAGTAGDDRPAEADPHLCSTEEVTGYRIQARDGQIGRIKDFVADQKSWNIGYVVVKTRIWLPGRFVLVAPTWTVGISWGESKVHLDLCKDTIKNSPRLELCCPDQ
jgi:hypothetical protein